MTRLEIIQAIRSTAAEIIARHFVVRIRQPLNDNEAR